MVRNAGIAAGAGALVGVLFWASFRFFVGTVTRVISWVYRLRDSRRGRNV